MRSIEISCDNCGKRRPLDSRPKTWWELEQVSEVQTTGTMDFCSLPCLSAWVTSDAVRTHPLLQADFAPQVVTGVARGV